MNTCTSYTATDNPELKQEGVIQLTQTRDAAMRIISGELNALIPTIGKMKDRDSLPDGLPEWLVSAYTEAGVLDGSPCLGTLREHLSKRTAHLVGIAQLGEHVTGASLASFIGLDLHKLANEGWAMLGSGYTAPVGGSINV